MFKDKRKLLAIAALSFGLCITFFGFISGIVAMCKGHFVSGAALIILMMGTGLVLTIVAFTSDDLP